MRSELIEWQVVKLKDGQIVAHSEGAQTIFGKTRAQKIVKALGPPWFIRNINGAEERQED